MPTEPTSIPLWAALLGYLIGSIPFGLLLTRAAGMGDVRKIGSGNIGATNVLRTGNKGLAAGTLLLDLLDSRAEVVQAPEGVRHTDDQLIRLAAQLQCPVLTVDRELKRRLIAEGSQIIEVVGGSALRLVS